MNPLIRYFKNKYNLCTEDEILNTLVTSNDDDIYDLLFRSDYLTSGMIRNIFINTKNSDILFKIISNPKCPSDVLEKIYSYVTTVDIISGHQLEKIAKSFSRYDYQNIIIKIINNPNCPISILRDLLLDYKTIKGKNFHVTDSNGKINRDIVIGQNIMSEVFKSPLLNEEDLEQFYDFSFANDYFLINPKCSKKVLNRLSHSVNEDDIYKILDNPNCPEDSLIKLYKTNKLRDTNVLSNIMLHPNFPKDMILHEIDSLRVSTSKTVKIINNKEFSEEEVREILFQPYYSQSFKTAIILSRHCSNELLLEFFKRKKILDEHILGEIAGKTNLPPSIQEILLNNSNSNVRYKLASNPTCQEGILIKLSKDEDKFVRNAVITNPNCPIEILFDLMNNGYDDYFEKKSNLRNFIFKNKHLTLKHIFTFFESDLAKENDKLNTEEIEILLNLIMNSDSSIEISESDIEMLKKHLDIDFSHVEKSLSKTHKRRVGKQKLDNFVKGNWFNKFTPLKKQEEDKSIEQLQSEEKKIKEKEETLINTAINAIKILGNSVIELEKINNFDAAKNFYHSAIVPNEILYIQVGEHYEIRPDLLPYLRFLNLYNSFIENLKADNINWDETNMRFDPQKVFNKDLSNTVIGNNNVKAGVDFSGVNLQNSDISRVEMPINLDFAITNGNTIFYNNSQLK